MARGQVLTIPSNLGVLVTTLSREQKASLSLLNSNDGVCYVKINGFAGNAPPNWDWKVPSQSYCQLPGPWESLGVFYVDQSGSNRNAEVNVYELDSQISVPSFIAIGRAVQMAGSTMDISEGNQPSNPPLGTCRLWSDGQGVVHHLHSDGTDYQLFDQTNVGHIGSDGSGDLVMDGSLATKVNQISWYNLTTAGGQYPNDSYANFGTNASATDAQASRFILRRNYDNIGVFTLSGYGDGYFARHLTASGNFNIAGSITFATNKVLLGSGVNVQLYTDAGGIFSVLAQGGGYSPVFASYFQTQAPASGYQLNPNYSMSLYQNNMYFNAYLGANQGLYWIFYDSASAVNRATISGTGQAFFQSSCSVGPGGIFSYVPGAGARVDLFNFSANDSLVNAQGSYINFRRNYDNISCFQIYGNGNIWAGGTVNAVGQTVGYGGYAVSCPNVANANGQMLAYGHITYSSVMHARQYGLKVVEIEHPIDLLHSISAYSYDHISFEGDTITPLTKDDGSFVSTPSYGFHAGEVAANIPEAATYDSEGNPIGVDAYRLLAILWETSQQLNKRLLALEIQQ